MFLFYYLIYFFNILQPCAAIDLHKKLSGIRWLQGSNQHICHVFLLLFFVLRNWQIYTFLTFTKNARFYFLNPDSGWLLFTVDLGSFLNCSQRGKDWKQAGMMHMHSDSTSPGLSTWSFSEILSCPFLNTSLFGKYIFLGNFSTFYKP